MRKLIPSILRIAIAIFTRIALTQVYTLCLAIHAVLWPVHQWASRRRLKKTTSQTGPRQYDVLLIGTFYTRNWCISHLSPLSKASNVNRIFAVVDGPTHEIDKVQYVYPPPWLVKMLGRAVAKFLYSLRLALRERPDLVMGYHLLPNALSALLVARATGAKSGYQMTAGPVEVIGGGAATENFFLKNLLVKSWVLERLAFALARRFDLVAVRGRGAQAFMQERGLGRLITVLPGSIRASRFQERVESRTYDVVSVCRLVPIKQPEHMIETLSRVARRRPGLRAAIVGDGPLMDTLRRMITDRKIDANVELVGHIEGVEKILVRSKIFLLTSRSEGLSIAMAEAMTAGAVPVVAAVGDLGDLVRHDDTGFLITPGSFDEYAQRICDLLEDDQRLHRLSEAATRAAVEHNAVENVADKWTAAFQRVCGSPKRTESLDPFRARLRRAIRHPSRRYLWDATPTPVKRAFSPLARVVPARWWLGRDFRRTLVFLERSQRWSADEVRAYQLENVRKVLRLAYDKTAYYRQQFDTVGFDVSDFKSLDQLQRLPTIDRETIGTQLERMCAVSPESPNVDYVSTGGTTGKPLGFYIGADRSAVEYAYLVSSWGRCGYELETPMAVFRGGVVLSRSRGLRHDFDPILRHHLYSNFHMGDEDIRRYLAHVRTIGPCFLHVYPSSATVLVRFFERTGEPVPPNIRGILAGSENVYEVGRERAKEVFQAPYFSWYGHSEKVILGAECEHSTDYHVWPTYGYMELLDEEGHVITTPGQRGEIAGTGFINTVVPFIRYRTGDYATYVGDHCDACGRAHTLIRDVRGHRTQEMLVASDGSLIAWTAINMHDRTFDDVRQLQFRQETPGMATLLVVPSDSFDDSSRRRIIASLDHKLDGQLKVSIELVSSIPLSSRGKATYVDQRLTVEESFVEQVGVT